MAHPDLDLLLNESLDAAEHFLESIGELFPFVVTMSPTGEIGHSQEHLGTDHTPKHETVETLLAGLKKSAPKYKATAVVSDVQTTPPGGAAEQPAIRVILEHRTEPPVTCFLPYKQEKGKYGFGEVFARKGERQVFVREPKK